MLKKCVLWITIFVSLCGSQAMADDKLDNTDYFCPLPPPPSEMDVVNYSVSLRDINNEAFCLSDDGITKEKQIELLDNFVKKGLILLEDEPLPIKGQVLKPVEENDGLLKKTERNCALRLQNNYRILEQAVQYNHQHPDTPLNVHQYFVDVLNFNENKPDYYSSYALHDFLLDFVEDGSKKNPQLCHKPIWNYIYHLKNKGTDKNDRLIRYGNGIIIQHGNSNNEK